MEDYQIAQKTPLQPIIQIAEKIGLTEQQLEYYGRYKAKISDYLSYSTRANQGEKLVLVTAINPTPAGEGKTTTSIGLADAINQIGYSSVVVLREPSLGPVFGIKGGAAGGGYSQVAPMEDINLHFTGDFHAIGSANNLLAAMLDNHIKQGNALQIDLNNITLKRVVDMNDRQLRYVQDGLPNPATNNSGTVNGVPRTDGFDITVASEVMAIFCLSANLQDLKQRLGQIVVAYNTAGQPVTAGDLKAQGAMAALLKDALKPNLVQTLAGTPAIIHGGPFANIAHGCNSVIATRTACGLIGASAGDKGIVVTEAGFGADLGAEKFLDINCRQSGLYPDAIVLVATIRALKHHGGAAKETLARENLPALQAGLSNLTQHIQNIQTVYQIPLVVAINQFTSDTEAELQLLEQEVKSMGVSAILTDVWARGGAGGTALAQKVVELVHISTDQNRFAYDLKLPIDQKIIAIAQKIYHADGVDFTPNAQAQIQKLTELGFANLPICIAKTQYSFSDNPQLLGAPRGFRIQVSQVKVSAGAGFIVAIAGNIMTMPGLPKIPAAEAIDVTDDGMITGIF
ncbi:MAG: formate--tetrahydrofolate ligase [Bifidobacteriaceae bacterium]|jgi:formate--tetrahydrofolate ligase|nr:formate--tetrahydrofolate ligase [Bifidobacteriaceae bacterium]